MRPSQTVSPRVTLSAIRRQRLQRVLHIMVAFLYWTALYLYVPTLPTYVQSKSRNLALAGLVLSQYGLWQALIRLLLPDFSQPTAGSSGVSLQEGDRQ